MRIVLDNIIFSIQKAGGISGAWAMLINEFLKRPELDCFFIEREDVHQNIFRNNIDIPASRILTHSHLPLIADRYMPVRMREDAYFIFHSSYYRYSPVSYAKNVVTLHDFIYEQTACHSFVAKAVHRLQKTKALSNASVIVPVSHTTQEELSDRLPDIKKKTSVIPNAAICRPDNALSASNRSGQDRYILYVGSRTAYKNFYNAACAASISDMPMVIAGAPLSDKERQTLNDITPQLRYCEIPNPTQEELSRLYTDAFCLLYPSSFEGFGIPILEAQAHGCPVIISNCKACMETAGAGAIISTSVDADALAGQINLLRRNDVRDNVILRGIANESRFSWKSIADAYIKIYAELLN